MKHPVWLILLVAAGWRLSMAPAVFAAEPITPLDVRHNLFSTCFINEREGWIVGELGRVLHTLDGGQTFERSATGTRSAFLSIACLPDRSVLIVGQHGLAMRSRDIGRTWERLQTGTKRDLISIGFATPQVGMAVGDFGTILRTADGGTTWTSVPIPANIPLPEDIAEIIEPGDILLYDVDFPTPERGWIVGEFGVIFATADGGQTWVAQASGVDTTLFGVAFTDAQHGWAVGIEQTMLRTSDGGATWQRQRVEGRPGFVLSLYDVEVQGSIGWAIGDSGLLLRSTDAGATWHRVELPIQLAANWFRGLSLTPSAAGFIVGSEGLMLATKREQLRQLKRRS